MELAQELFVTAVVAVLFSFIVAKLVSVAICGDAVGGSDRGKVGGVETAGRVAVVEEAKFEEKLSSPSAGSEKRVEVLDQKVSKVDRFEAETVVVERVIEESVGGEKTEQECGEVVDEPSEVTELLEKSVAEGDSREAEVVAEKAVKCDVEEMKVEDNDCLREVNESRDVEVQFPAVDIARTAEVDVQEEEEEEQEIADEDDWEGIEKSELEKDFAAASKYVDDMNEGVEAGVGDDVKMQLYGLRKVATEGPCRESPPMALKVAARAKWNAWQRLGNMSPDVAMEQYINLLSESIPNWSEAKSAEMSKSHMITLRHEECHLAAVPCHQAESVGVRETSPSPEVNPKDPSLEENSMGRAKE